MTTTQLDVDELRRYARHLVLPEVGVEGQRRLKSSGVAVVGAGGLGSPVALYLAAAGVGRIGLIDFDAVDEGNLQRQVLYASEDVGRLKLEVAAERLRLQNPHIRIDTHAVRLEARNALEILESYDVVVDGTDNFPTRYLVNDACALLGKPNVYGSIFRFEGQVSVFWKGRGPCYRCIFPEPPPAGAVPNCAEGGVLGILPGVIGTLQATEVIKLLLQRGTPLLGRLLLYDALDARFRELGLRPDPDCPLCGEHPAITQLTDIRETCDPAAGSPQPDERTSRMTVSELKQRMEAEGGPALLDVREPYEREIASIPNAIAIPLAELPERIEELDRGRELVVHCKSGGRSARAVQFLNQQGFENVHNLEGGILAWIEEIDPTLSRY